MSCESLPATSQYSREVKKKKSMSADSTRGDASLVLKQSTHGIHESQKTWPLTEREHESIHENNSLMTLFSPIGLTSSKIHHHTPPHWGPRF